MREDGERVRAWKAAKEKEVAQLRQAERKQVKTSKFSDYLKCQLLTFVQGITKEIFAGFVNGTFCLVPLLLGHSPLGAV